MTCYYEVNRMSFVGPLIECLLCSYFFTFCFVSMHGHISGIFGSVNFDEVNPKIYPYSYYLNRFTIDIHWIVCPTMDQSWTHQIRRCNYVRSSVILGNNCTGSLDMLHISVKLKYSCRNVEMCFLNNKSKWPWSPLRAEQLWF